MVLKDLHLLIWLTQLGLSVAVPPVVTILLALWLRDDCHWGGWVLWVGIGLGVILAIDGLRLSLHTLKRLSEPKEKDPLPPSFNDHD